MVSTALIRVFGRQLAELPLLATSPSHQGQVGIESFWFFLLSKTGCCVRFRCNLRSKIYCFQDFVHVYSSIVVVCLMLLKRDLDLCLLQGHCKALLLSIERLLGVLRVERLALPAADGAEGIWVNKFGFARMSAQQVRIHYSLFFMLDLIPGLINMMHHLPVLCL